MHIVVKKIKKLSGEITPPADKSITHRAIMLSALAEGESIIENYLNADDCMRTVSAFEQLGIKIEQTPKVLKVYGEGLNGLKTPSSVIDAGNSGTTARLIAGVLAGQNILTQITGDESLSLRPMKRIIEPLRKMGAKIIAKEDNFLPMQIKGNPDLEPIYYESPVSSAQVKSCVLLAGIQAKGVTRFSEPVKSRDHTERMLKARGVDLRFDKTAVSIIGPAELKPMNIKIPGDISSAAFFIVGTLLVKGSRIIINNVGINPTRAGILNILQFSGANIVIEHLGEVSGEPVGNIVIEASSLKPFNITKEIVPDLIDEIPILVLAATQAHGTSVISGASELRVKESDRLKAISSELNLMGADITEKEDGLVINGPTKLKGAKVRSYGDHRIAMTLMIAGSIASGSTVLDNIDCVKISFPAFMEELKHLGAE